MLRIDKLNVPQCASCGQEHEELEFQQLSYDLCTYWASCPVSGEPLRIYRYDIANVKAQDDADARIFDSTSITARDLTGRKLDAPTPMPFPAQKDDGIRLPPSVIMDLITWRDIKKKMFLKHGLINFGTPTADHVEQRRLAEAITEALVAFLPIESKLPDGWPPGAEPKLEIGNMNGVIRKTARMTAWKLASRHLSVSEPKEFKNEHIGITVGQLRALGFEIPDDGRFSPVHVLWHIEHGKDGNDPSVYFLPPECFQ